jgi:hypothetical protein
LRRRNARQKDNATVAQASTSSPPANHASSAPKYPVTRPGGIDLDAG